MESKHGYKQIIALLICSLFLGACLQKKAENKDLATTYQFQSGDIILRLGNGFFSGQFKKYASKDQLFSHIGVIERQEDSLFVIHSEASELTGIGYVKRELLSVFIENIQTWGVYRFDTCNSMQTQIAECAKKYYLCHTPFDLDFDKDDDSKVYCSELVAISINQAFNDTIVRASLTLKDRLFFGLDDIYKLHNINKIFLSTDASNN